MIEIIFLSFYLSLVKIILRSNHRRSLIPILNYVKNSKQEILLNGTKNITYFSNDHFIQTQYQEDLAKKKKNTPLKQLPNSTINDIRLIQKLLLQSLRAGKSTIHPMNTLIYELQKANHYFKEVAHHFYNLVLRISIFIVLSLIGRLFVHFLFLDDTFKALQKLDYFCLNFSIIIAISSLIYIKKQLPTSWLFEKNLSFSAKDLLIILFTDESPRQKKLRDTWLHLKHRELEAGINLSFEKKLAQKDWLFGLELKQSQSIEKLQTIVPVIELVVGTISGSLILIIPIKHIMSLY